jgi:hypothetical protein
LAELRQDAHSKASKDKQVDLPGGEFQMVFKHDQSRKKVTSIIEWASLYHNLIALYEFVGNKWATHQAIKNGGFCHGLISKDKHTSKPKSRKAQRSMEL